MSVCQNCFKAHRAYLARERRRKARECNAAPLPESGKLVRDEDGRVQCHICGSFYKSLDPHVRQLHGYASLYDYKEDFQLNRRQGLCSPDVSEQDRQNLINSGWAGKLLDYNLSRFAESREMRLQSRLNQSKAHKGKPVATTPARVRAAKENYQKSLILLNCQVCGAPTLTQKTQGHVFCATCRPEHRREYGRKWRMANVGRIKAYHKAYPERKKRGEIKPRKLTITPVKLAAQRQNQLLSQVKDTPYICSLCGELFYSRRCEAKCHNHFCSSCQPKARILTIKAWRQSHPEACRAALVRYREKKKRVMDNSTRVL